MSVVSGRRQSVSDDASDSSLEMVSGTLASAGRLRRTKPKKTRRTAAPLKKVSDSGSDSGSECYHSCSDTEEPPIKLDVRRRSSSPPKDRRGARATVAEDADRTAVSRAKEQTLVVDGRAKLRTSATHAKLPPVEVVSLRVCFARNALDCAWFWSSIAWQWLASAPVYCRAFFVVRSRRATRARAAASHFLECSCGRPNSRLRTFATGRRRGGAQRAHGQSSVVVCRW